MTSPIAGEREAEAAITPDNPVECTTCGALVVGVAPLSGVAADGRLGVAVSLLTECLGPLEVAAAVIESEDGNEAIETLIAQVRKFCADAKVAALLEPVGEALSAPAVETVAVQEAIADERKSWADASAHDKEIASLALDCLAHRLTCRTPLPVAPKAEPVGVAALAEQYPDYHLLLNAFAEHLAKGPQADAHVAGGGNGE